MKFIVSLLLMTALLAGPVMAIEPLSGDAIDIPAPYAVLMEKSTGTVIYEKDSHTRCSPASVTKVMTMLLVMEAIESGRLNWDGMVTASATAASMGGSQIWLEEGERMSVEEMLKCVAVVSANDCAVALAEEIAGSESAFVQMMNTRAQELGMTDTNFTNCTGLHEDENHYTSAYDIALMSAELLLHEEIKTYTTIWMDSIRDGEFGLSNTNKLIFYFDGATGLKTGFTSKAMYCLSASAERDGVEYISVVLHADTSAERFDSAKALLNYGFANYELLSLRPDEALAPVRVELGIADCVQPVFTGDEVMLVEKGAQSTLSYDIDLLERVEAPVESGAVLGKMTVRSGDQILKETDLVASSSVKKITFGGVFLRLLYNLLGT